MDSIFIWVFLVVVLLGIITLKFVRGPWADEMLRLNQHRKKMQKKYHEEEEVNIFLAQQKTNYLAQKLAQAGLEAKYEQMKIRWIVSSLMGGVICCILACIYLPELNVIGFFAGLFVGAGGFITYIGHMAKTRQSKIMEQLPQTLETMVSSLRAGSPVIEVFKVLAETGTDPIRSEFKRGLVSLQLGKPFREAMQEMSTRINTADFKLLSQAIFISQDVGGNLADVVATIADTIRERFKLRDYMNSLTAQGKMTAGFIGCLPYLITLFTYCLCPGYIVPFLNHPIARIVIVGLVLWELVGAWILVRMTTFEV
jgi:tight adherence protein B